MSASPYWFASLVLTGCTVRPELWRHHMKGSASGKLRQPVFQSAGAANENAVWVPPRAAHSHSASVGSRSLVVPRYRFSLPMKLPNVQLEPVAPPQTSFQLTESTGQSRPQPG